VAEPWRRLDAGREHGRRIQLLLGDGTPDIANASRRIKSGELDTCTKNGVTEVVEVKIGYDGIVLANSKKHGRFDLSKEQVFRALAKQVPIDGKLTANPYKLWSDIDPSLPKQKIEVLGPPPTSGTRDAFVELAMEGGAEAFPMLKELKGKDEKAFKARPCDRETRLRKAMKQQPHRPARPTRPSACSALPRPEADKIEAPGRRRRATRGIASVQRSRALLLREEVPHRSGAGPEGVHGRVHERRRGG
jgi:hypothetical protein